jgi:hypothetical protein
MDPPTLGSQHALDHAPVASQPRTIGRGAADGAAVLAVARDGGGEVGDIGVKRDPKPHVPVAAGRPEAGAEASRPLVGRAADDHGRGRDQVRRDQRAEGDRARLDAVGIGGSRPVGKRAAGLVHHVETGVYQPHPRMRFEQCDAGRERSREVGVVGVEPGDVATARIRETGVAVRGHPQRTVVSHDPQPRVANGGQHLRRRVGGRVVVDNHLQPRHVLRQRAFDRRAQKRRLVSGRDADADHGHCGPLRKILLGTTSV